MSDSSHPSLSDCFWPEIPLPDPAVPWEIYAGIARLGIGDQLAEVIALTRELFGDFTIDITEDPEIYNCSYVTFHVRSPETMERVLEKETEWFCRLPRTPTQAPGSYCISVDFI
jgi:hypothetical protein